jgi:hypothetical protein
MARRMLAYQPSDIKYRGGDLKREPDDLAVEFLVETGLFVMFDKMTPAFPASIDLLMSWVDEATAGLYHYMRARNATYAKFYQPPYGGGTLGLLLEDPTYGSLLFGAMRDLTIKVLLRDPIPPPFPTQAPIPVPSSWVDDAAILGWVRTALRARADQERLRAILKRAIVRTRLRPWTVLAAFSPAFAGWHGHAFRPTTDLWRVMPEPDIAFVEKLVPTLLLHTRHPGVAGQAVDIRSTKGRAW